MIQVGIIIGGADGNFDPDEKQAVREACNAVGSRRRSSTSDDGRARERCLAPFPRTACTQEECSISSSVRWVSTPLAASLRLRITLDRNAAPMNATPIRPVTISSTW